MKLHAFLAISLLVVACGGDAPIGSDATKLCSPVPPETLLMQHEFSEAESFRYACYNNAEQEFQICMSRGMSPESCHESERNTLLVCDDVFTHRANKIPLRTCGVRIFNNEGGLTVDENGNIHTNPNDEDEDGDGVSTWFEFLMGLNPCTAESFGSCWNDGELDYDADGVSNAEDEAPLCNLDDPGEYGYECV